MGHEENYCKYALIKMALFVCFVLAPAVYLRPSELSRIPGLHTVCAADSWCPALGLVSAISNAGTAPGKRIEPHQDGRTGRRMNVFVNDAISPTLQVGRLEEDAMKGGLRLQGRGTAAWFGIGIFRRFLRCRTVRTSSITKCLVLRRNEKRSARSGMGW